MVDLRCFGESACPDDAQRIGERLADVRAAAAWLRRAGARTVAVAGVSMGGTIAVAHGWSLFTDDGRTPTRWAEQVAAFLRTS
jgi:pimeloyl-ACP methyl ester carboxylesterase